MLLYDQISAMQRTNYMNAVEHQTPTPDMTQANKVWKARAVGVRGCIMLEHMRVDHGGGHILVAQQRLKSHDPEMLFNKVSFFRSFDMVLFASSAWLEFGKRCKKSA